MVRAKAVITKSNKYGFGLMEAVVVVFIFSFIAIMTGSSYLLAQRSFNKGAAESELTQNIRVSLDRLTRELRQSNAIVTVMPSTDDDELNPPASEIIFQDGHDNELITYIRYYIFEGNLYRRHYAFYFEDTPDEYVVYNSKDAYGHSPFEELFSNNIVGEYFLSAAFWGALKEVHIRLELKKNDKTMRINTTVFSRND